ncbi:MAG: ABC transporter substrate-binding protein [Geminicoccaceae bacterium]
MNRTRRELLRDSLLAGTALGLPSLGGDAFAADAKPLRVRATTDVSILDPGYMTGGVEIDVLRAVVPRLVAYQQQGDRIGWAPTDILKSVKPSDDGLSIDFELKPGFTWTNGFGDVTAEDVKYSFERLPGSDWGGDWAVLDKVEVTGPLTGSIKLKQAFAPFLMTALAGSSGFVLSKQAMEKAGGKFTVDIPATCGPYLYKWTPKQQVVFTPNPDWAGTKPAFDEVRYIIIDDNKAAELAFEAGEIDAGLISSQTFARYKKEPPANSATSVAGALQYMWLGMNTQHEKLKDIRVRQAIQHAVDVASILDGAYEGTTERAYGVICPGLIGKRNSTKIDYDPEKAKALLQEAGVSGLTLDLRTLNTQDRLLTAQIIQANLQAIGIDAKIIPMDSGPFWDMGVESKGDTWKDLQLWIMRFGSGLDPYEPMQWFRKDQIGIWNWERWSDDEFETLLKQGIEERDPAKRDQIYQRMQEIMEDTGAYLFICHEPEVFARRADLLLDLQADGQMNFAGFKPA